MRVALEQARAGEGCTRPNPPVGAVLVRKGKAMVQGYHRKAGGPHAEAGVLREAGARARGATLYVTLEPCSTQGRTPPCTEAILASGVARVVVGASDPNPSHAGRGLRILRRAGLEVTARVCEAEARELIEPFGKWIQTGRPWVTLKLGMTLDGRIADVDGASRWITGSKSRALTQSYRRRCDAVLVGAETARLDNPSLLPRPARGRKPWRVVLSGDANLPTALQLFSDGLAERTLVLTTRRASSARRRRLERTGAEVLVLPEESGRPSIAAMLEELGRRGLLHVLCEGGGQVAASLLKAGAADDLLLFHAPLLLGGAARAAIGSPGWALSEAPRLKRIWSRWCGDDHVMLCRPLPASTSKK